MLNRWTTPVAAAAMLSLLACGGGEQSESRRERGTSAGKAAGAAPAASGGYTVAAVSGGGSITGRISFQGTPPAAEKIEVSKDTAVCGTEKVLETVQIDSGGGLKDVVVWIDGISSGKDWGALDGGMVDQVECHYSPYIQIVRNGDELEILNSDPILHNIHAYHNNKETIFNIAQPMKGMKTPKKLEKTGPVHLKCDVHSWMSAWVFVAGHPYYTVSASDGTFSMPDVPAGTYKVKAWHAKFGEKIADVTVSAGGAATADFSMP